MRKESGTVGDLMSVTLCMLAMTVLLTNYMDSIRFIQQKMQISQIARKYILQMETVGGLDAERRNLLRQELEDVGVTALQLEGTTVGQVTYGEEIVLQIRGELADDYEFTEKRVSTAKH